MTSTGHNISGRRRWTPTPLQLQILERIFEKGNGTPGKRKIREITTELCQHGQISETNVYNWFQNRRARSRRKQLNADSEAETGVELPNEKKTKPEELQSEHVLTTSTRPQELCDQNPETSTAICSTEMMRASKAEALMQSDGSSKHTEPFNQMSLYGRSYQPYMQAEDYIMNMIDYESTGNYT